MNRIFIVGTPRAGTTLLQSLIGCSPELQSFPETHFFDKTIKNIWSFPLVYRQAATIIADFEKELDISESIREMMRGVSRPFSMSPSRHAKVLINYLDQLTRLHNKEAWLEKTPRHLDYIDLIEASCCASRPSFVHIIRERDANVKSLVEAAALWAEFMPESKARRRWELDVFAHRRYLGRPGHFFVFYEELTKSPFTVTLALGRELRIALTSAMLERWNEVARGGVTAGASWQSNNLTSRIVGRSNDAQISYSPELTEALRALRTGSVSARI